MHKPAKSREVAINGVNVTMTVRENNDGPPVIVVGNTEGLFGQFKKSDFDAFREEFNRELDRIRKRRA